MWQCVMAAKIDFIQITKNIGFGISFKNLLKQEIKKN